MGMEANVKLNVPESEIRQAIALAVGEALSGSKAKLVDAVVRAALLQPPNSGYDRTTPLEKAVMELVRNEANVAIKAWVEKHRATVQELVKDALDKHDFASAIAKAATDSLAKNVYASVSANIVLVRKEEEGG